MPEFDIFSLPNGVRVVHRAVERPVGHLNFHLAIGSRDEREEEQGLAHFTEHCLFKGTRRRRAYHILSRMEDAGGELNAYTGKEEMVMTTSFLRGDYPRAADLLSDVLLHSTFPEREVAKEREVVLDEINSYRDNPSESIFDDFEEQLFAGHSLGRNILGRPASVRSFQSADISRFIQKHLGSNVLVISSVGPISSQRLQKLLSKTVGREPLQVLHRNKHKPSSCRQSLVQKRPIHQTHAVLGTAAYAARSPGSLSLMLLNNLLGGPGMNSRLNLNIRERYGFTYYLESFYQPYSDTGLFGIYLATDPGTAHRTIELIYKEMRKLRDKPLGVLQLQRAKRQMLGQWAMAQENNAALAQAYGKSLLMFDHIENFDSITRKVEAISSKDLQAVAQELLQPEDWSSLMYRSPS